MPRVQNTPTAQSPTDKMVQEIISHLKRRKLWETDVGVIYKGQSISHRGTFPTNEKTRGVARIWFEGRVYRMMNYSEGDTDFKLYKSLQEIMRKYGYYFEFQSACDINIYPI